MLVAAENGHLEVVRLLVESGANKDQGMIDDGATPLLVGISQRATLKLCVCWLSRVPAKTRARLTMEQRLYS